MPYIYRTSTDVIQDLVERKAISIGATTPSVVMDGKRVPVLMEFSNCRHQYLMVDFPSYEDWKKGKLRVQDTLVDYSHAQGRFYRQQSLRLREIMKAMTKEVKTCPKKPNIK